MYLYVIINIMRGSETSLYTADKYTCEVTGERSDDSKVTCQGTCICLGIKAMLIIKRAAADEFKCYTVL